MKNCSVYILKDTEVTSHNWLIRWVTNGRQCSAMQAPFARFVCFEISRFRGGPTSYILTSDLGLKKVENYLSKAKAQISQQFGHETFRFSKNFNFVLNSLKNNFSIERPGHWNLLFPCIFLIFNIFLVDNPLFCSQI